MIYKIKLPNFEGPFDLLLYFIKRDELNIYDIPIARITEEFLKYIRLMQSFDLELAGEFLSMAANLIYIKTQMLLPKEESEDGSEPEDPRAALVQRIVEYKRFKEAAADMEFLSEAERYSYYRRLFSADEQTAAANRPQGYRNATAFDLFSAFQKCIDRLRKENYKHVVETPAVSVEDRKKYILGTFNRRSKISFFDIVKDTNRNILVVTFLAILDLVKIKLATVYQSELFDDIIICKTDMTVTE